MQMRPPALGINLNRGDSNRKGRLSESEDKMTGFRNFVLSCALAATSVIPPAAPAKAMPRPALDIAPTAAGDIEPVRHRGSYYGWGPRYHRPWSGHYGGWGRGYYPRRSGISIYFGTGPGYYPGRHYYGNRYYFGPRYYGPGYYSYRYFRPDYGYRHYRPGYVRRGYSAHVNWCLSRYRSYNPATNRYLAYSGLYRVCYSPYR